MWLSDECLQGSDKAMRDRQPQTPQQLFLGLRPQSHLYSSFPPLRSLQFTSLKLFIQFLSVGPTLQIICKQKPSLVILICSQI